MRPLQSDASHTLAGIIRRAAAATLWQRLVGRGGRAQSCNHLHDAGQDHMTRAQGATAFQGRAVWVLFNMQVWFHRDWLPAAHRINGDLLIVRTKSKEKEVKNWKYRTHWSLFWPRSLHLDRKGMPDHYINQLTANWTILVILMPFWKMRQPVLPWKCLLKQPGNL